jgi:hypothetical protein
MPPMRTARPRAAIPAFLEMSIMVHDVLEKCRVGGWRGGVDFYFEFLPAKSQIEESISILNFFPPNRGVDQYLPTTDYQIPNCI